MRGLGNMAPGGEGEEEEGAGTEQYAGVALVPPEQMDPRPLFQAVDTLCQDNIKHFGESKAEVGARLVQAFARIQEQALGVEPSIRALAAVCPLFDLDPDTPANGYRSLLKVVLSCTQHILHKCRYITASRHSLFFRAAHNCAELEAYGAALTQLRALLCFAQRLLTANQHGDLFFRQERGLSEEFLREYSTMHKGCFYGRCMGFQFTPSIRPFLQTISIGLVSFGENYKRHESGISVAASSFFISGRYAMDPERRGADYERITQNLDVNFWKSFWNITEMELLASLVGIATTVRINKILSVPPEPLEMPLSSNPQLTVTISPPVAHSGPGPVTVRLISYQLREGQESEELNVFTKPEGPLSLDLRLRSRPAPLSPDLIIHFHGGGFVAQTSKSHEPYLKIWAQELEAPILSVDYSLAPEAPFPRALEECFYAYCWALKHCRLLGSTGERVCLAGDSAGGNLCITVAMRAASVGVRLPDGIMVAYPATLLQATASPSRLLTLMDPLLPLSVLSKCLSAYAGTERVPVDERAVEKQQSSLSQVKRGTALFLRDIRQGAASWLSNLMEGSKDRANPDTVRKSVSEAALADESLLNRKVSLKSKTCQDLNRHQYMEETSFAVGTPNQHSGQSGAPNKHANSGAQSDGGSSSSANRPHSPSSLSIQSEGSEALCPTSPQKPVNFFLTESESEGDASFDGEPSTHSKENIPPAHSSEDQSSPQSPSTSLLGFPEGFQPLRSQNGVAHMTLQTSAIVENPYMSPLLAPDSMLQGLPPIHIVACSLDPMLDDSVMFAKRLRSLNRPVTLKVVEDLPHGFLSLSQLSPETRTATTLCVQRIRQVLREEPPAPPPAAPRKHRKLERTLGKSAVTDREIGA
ncbi:hormone-sensitive lipase isoform X2 [Rana temporaria]|uniref:hormone-sensitive lipase isoform X2 n=1 Tax=Rana temporaria TaxID=8407 RepID=UPI001AAC6266|nr:hormone-sensitive lipase isoform X2 [Rana temporaria]